MKILLRRSRRGVPHMLVTYKGITFSVCYFGKGEFYRIFLANTDTKLQDFQLAEGGSFNLEFVLDGLIEKFNLK